MGWGGFLISSEKGGKACWRRGGGVDQRKREERGRQPREKVRGRTENPGAFYRGQRLLKGPRTCTASRVEGENCRPIKVSVREGGWGKKKQADKPGLIKRLLDQERGKKAAAA